MPRYVLKFGGTSLADISQIQNIASKIKLIADQGHELIVVVSAMASKTNELISLPKSDSFLMIFAACKILSIEPTDVPPNFKTFFFII